MPPEKTMPIAVLLLTTRAAFHAEQLGITSVETLAAYSKRDLLKIRGIGTKVINEYVETLSEVGFSLCPEATTTILDGPRHVFMDQTDCTVEGCCARRDTASVHSPCPFEPHKLEPRDPNGAQPILSQRATQRIARRASLMDEDNNLLTASLVNESTSLSPVMDIQKAKPKTLTKKRHLKKADAVKAGLDSMRKRREPSAAGQALIIEHFTPEVLSQLDDLLRDGWITTSMQVLPLGDKVSVTLSRMAAGEEPVYRGILMQVLDRTYEDDFLKLNLLSGGMVFGGVRYEGQMIFSLSGLSDDITLPPKSPFRWAVNPPLAILTEGYREEQTLEPGEHLFIIPCPDGIYPYKLRLRAPDGTVLQDIACGNTSIWHVHGGLNIDGYRDVRKSINRALQDLDGVVHEVRIRLVVVTPGKVEAELEGQVNDQSGKREAAAEAAHDAMEYGSVTIDRWDVRGTLRFNRPGYDWSWTGEGQDGPLPIDEPQTFLMGLWKGGLFESFETALPPGVALPTSSPRRPSGSQRKRLQQDLDCAESAGRMASLLLKRVKQHVDLKPEDWFKVGGHLDPAAFFQGIIDYLRNRASFYRVPGIPMSESFSSTLADCLEREANVIEGIVAHVAEHVAGKPLCSAVANTIDNDLDARLIARAALLDAVEYGSVVIGPVASGQWAGVTGKLEFLQEAANEPDMRTYFRFTSDGCGIESGDVGVDKAELWLTSLFAGTTLPIDAMELVDPNHELERAMGEEFELPPDVAERAEKAIEQAERDLASPLGRRFKDPERVFLMDALERAMEPQGEPDSLPAGGQQLQEMGFTVVAVEPVALPPAEDNGTEPRTSGQPVEWPS